MKKKRSLRGRSFDGGHDLGLSRSFGKIALIAVWTIIVPPAATAVTQTPVVQSSSATHRGVDAITPTVFSEYQAALSAESLRVPQSLRAGEGSIPELERIAGYVAEQFRRLDFVPEGDAGAWLQRVPVPGRLRLDSTKSQLMLLAYLSSRGHEIRSEIGSDDLWRLFSFNLGSAAHVLPFSPEVLSGGEDGPLLVTGHHSAASIRQASIGRQVVLYVPPTGEAATVQEQVIAELRRTTPWLMVVEADQAKSVTADAQTSPPGPPVYVTEPYLAELAQRRGVGWTLGVSDSLAAAFLEVAGSDLQRARTTTAPGIQQLRARIYFDAKAVADSTMPTVPNVIGVLKGSDSTLNNQALVITARMDGPRGAVNVAGLLALARAVQSAPPRRSVVFAAVSDGADQWGSHFLAHNRWGWPKLVAHLAVDLSNPPAGDTVMLYGAPDLEGVSPPAMIAASHPELGLELVDGGTAFQPMVDGFAFVSEGILSLTLRRGAGDKVTQRGAQRADPAESARLLQLAYYLEEALSNAERPPRWSAAGRRVWTMPAHP